MTNKITLSEEQKQKIIELCKQTDKKSLKLIFKTFGLVLVLSAFNLYIGLDILESDKFIMVSSFLTALLFFGNLSHNLKQELDLLDQKVKQILKL